MKYKAVFFDFDGTLMDTSEGIYAGAHYSMAKVGCPMPEHPKWNEFIGPPILECFRITFGIDDVETQKKLAETYHDFYVAEGRFKARFYPGITQVLRQLKEKGYKLGIASMKTDDLVKEMVAHFGIADLFDQVLGSRDNLSKAQLLKEGFDRLGIEAKDCVLVGDTIFDQYGAEGAGCGFIAVDWGFGFAPGHPGAISKAEQILDLV